MLVDGSRKSKIRTYLKKIKKKYSTYFKKTNRKRLFHPPKWPNLGCQFGKKCRFSSPLSTYELYFWLVGHEKKIKIVPPNSLNDLKKKEKKYTRFSPKNIWKGKYAPHPHHTPPTPHPTHTIRHRKVCVVGGSYFEINKLKEREHSNKWDPLVRFFKEPLLWGIRPKVIGVVENWNRIIQGNDSHSTKGPLGEVL